MLECNITLTGKTTADLLISLDKVRKQIADDFLGDTYSNNNGTFFFDIKQQLEPTNLGFAVRQKVKIHPKVFVNRRGGKILNLAGKTGIITKVNPKRLKVSFEGARWNIPPALLIRA